MQLSYSSENNDKKIKKQGTARFIGGVVEEVFGRLLQNLRRKHDRFLLQGPIRKVASSPEAP